MMISKDEEVNFEFSYSAVGGNLEKKKMNKFQSSHNVLTDIGVVSNRLAEKAAQIATGSHSLSP